MYFTAPTLPTEHWHAKVKFFALWLVLFTLSTWSVDSVASKNIRLEQKSEAIDLRLHSDILILSEREASFAEVLSPQLNTQFRPLELGDLNLLAQYRQYWLRFRISNSTNAAIFRQLEISPANAQDISLYDISTEGQHALLAPQLSSHKRAIYQILLPAHSSSDIYLKLDNAATHQISATLFSTPSLLESVADREFESGLFYGFLLALFIGNLMGIFVYRERLFFILCLICGVTLTSHTLIWDYLSQQTLPLLWIKPVLAIGALALITLQLFYAKGFPVFPREKQHESKMAINVMAAANIIVIASTLFLGTSISTILMNTLAFISSLLIIFLAAYTFFTCYSRVILYFLLTRLFITAVYSLVLLSYYLEMASLEAGNTLIMTATIITLSAETILLVVRGNRAAQKQGQHSKRIELLSEIDHTKAAILTKITHDIRTPLSAMLGISELLQETRLTATQQDYVLTMQRSSHELLRQVEEASQVVRFNDKDVRLSVQEFNLAELISEILSSFKNLAAEYHKDIICDIDNSLNANILGDSSRIKQMLSNIISSGLDNSEGDGIILQAKHSPEQHGGIVFELLFTGKVFDESQLRAINKLSPAHKASAQEDYTTPLAIAARLATLMAGELKAENTANNSCAIHCQIAVQIPRHSNTNVHVESDALRGKQLLVINRNETFCEVVDKQCRQLGMTVLAAHDQVTSLAMVRNQKSMDETIDFILFDYEIESGSTLALAKKIRDEHDADACPIGLLLSHSNTLFSQHELEQANIRRVLSKPMSTMALRSALLGEVHFQETKDLNINQYRPEVLQQSLHCLIAEDNPTNAHVLKRMLKSIGISFKHVENGQQVISSFQREHFDFVIMDIEMPIMDGVEATKRIRNLEQEFQKERTPIFGLTANALDEQRDIYLQAGMDLHLVKPLRLWELAEAIKRWTGYQHSKTDKTGGDNSSDQTL